LIVLAHPVWNVTSSANYIWLCLVPLNFPNFPSHRNHIETLNIAHDAFMEH
jgi:hypothetical protein